MAEHNTKRIAKNTLFLYVRMIVLMGISLYTSRIILEALGVSDYGIYNVVGGLVSMLSIISGSITAAISRYLTYEMGRSNRERLCMVFSTSLKIMLILSLLVVMVGETVGLWFVNTQMQFPEGKLYAANWVYQLSLVAFVIRLIIIPYNATIVSHEKMAAFAYISIAEGIGKLAIAFLILVDFKEKLVYYAVLMFLLQLAVASIYLIYCRRNFTECKYRQYDDKALRKEIFGFAGWNFIGAASAILRDQGGNVLLNIFFGTVVNAAAGIAMQVNHAVSGFVTNFTTALNPQITKSYSGGDRAYMMKLVFQGARLSFYMLLVISLPIIINIDYILSIWLTEVPEYTSLFTVLVLVFAMSESISHPLITAMLATGRIRNYQIVVGGLQMMNLPVTYMLFKLGMNPQVVYITAIVISQVCFGARLVMLRKMIDLKVSEFIRQVYFNVIGVSALSLIGPVIAKPYISLNFPSFLLNVFFIVMWTLTVIYGVGLSKSDKAFVRAKIKDLRNRYRCRDEVSS